MTGNRIRTACECHLVWAFLIATPTNTWESYYSVGGFNEEVESEPSSTSRAIEGAYQFLKLYLYLNTWKEKWRFILELLQLKLEGWLSYLKSTQHMANLWVEREDMETFKPRDTSPRDGDYISRMYPHYHLSDAALLWLALLQLEKMIQLIEAEFAGQSQSQSLAVESMVKDVRHCLVSYQKDLSLHKIRSNIIETFKVPKSGSQCRVHYWRNGFIWPSGSNFGRISNDVCRVCGQLSKRRRSEKWVRECYLNWSSQ